MLERRPRKDRTEVTFVLPADTPPGPVSVVGDFNDWQPGIHTLTPRKDGNRAVTVAL
ncbi:isoamylase early set domain-containing protein, partial [Streptomyces sp. NPDC054904]